MRKSPSVSRRFMIWLLLLVLDKCFIIKYFCVNFKSRFILAIDIVIISPLRRSHEHP